MTNRIFTEKERLEIIARNRSVPSRRIATTFLIKDVNKLIRKQNRRNLIKKLKFWN